MKKSVSTLSSSFINELPVAVVLRMTVLVQIAFLVGCEPFVMSALESHSALRTIKCIRKNNNRKTFFSYVKKTIHFSQLARSTRSHEIERATPNT